MYLAWKAMPLQITMQERTTRLYIEATSLSIHDLALYLLPRSPTSTFSASISRRLWFIYLKITFLKYILSVFLCENIYYQKNDSMSPKSIKKKKNQSKPSKYIKPRWEELFDCKGQSHNEMFSSRHIKPFHLKKKPQNIVLLHEIVLSSYIGLPLQICR